MYWDHAIPPHGKAIGFDLVSDKKKKIFILLPLPNSGLLSKVRTWPVKGSLSKGDERCIRAGGAVFLSQPYLT